jgi:hypothetical protein
MALYSESRGRFDCISRRASDTPLTASACRFQSDRWFALCMWTLFIYYVVYITPQPDLIRFVTHRPKPMSCMCRNTAHAYLCWIPEKQIREFSCKCANPAPARNSAHSNKSVPRKTDQPILLNMLRQSTPIRTTSTRAIRAKRSRRGETGGRLGCSVKVRIAYVFHLHVGRTGFVPHNFTKPNRR